MFTYGVDKPDGRDRPHTLTQTHTELDTTWRNITYDDDKSVKIG